MRRILIGSALHVLVLLLALMPMPAVGAGHRVADDEAVLLFATSAGLDPSGQRWQVPIHGWIFEPERGSWWRAAVKKGILEMLELDSPDPASETLERRLMMFLVDNERGKTVNVAVHDLQFSVGPSGADGHFEGRVDIARQPLSPVSDSAGVAQVVTTVSAADGRQFKGRVQLLPGRGLSVISDIDDTIKVSQVLDKSELLANTFLREFRAVPGMAAAYRRWADQGAAFHYVSASPWQLYPALTRFLDRAGFPPGEVLLRRLRVKDRRFFAFMGQSRDYKTQAILDLIGRFPERTFILVGDSGESDPAIYAAIARAHPRSVAAIFIRLVLDDEAHRRQTATHFHALPQDRWTLFSSGHQL